LINIKLIKIKNMQTENIKAQIKETINTIGQLPIDEIEKSAGLLANTLSSGKKILLCGNGGSAADCQHFAAEMIIRFRSSVDRKALPAIALTTDSSILTAGGNDIGFENIFARQVEALGDEGDTLIAITTSGNSPNIMNAIIIAKSIGMNVIGLLGGNGGRVLGQCTASVVVPHHQTNRIQESHLLIEHIWCDVIERMLFPAEFK
jgi:D-sedoheptulose 7-phosphate isomerase